ncbi:MAG: helix-turn-helix transcriptional regulator [Bacteroidota bacterium]
MIPTAISQELGVTLDLHFLKKAHKVVRKNLVNPDFTVTLFADEMCMSRMNLHRKLIELENCSASGFIRQVRLQKAAQMIRNSEGNITQICYDVGFNHPSYFARRFKEIYGILPSEYAKNVIG